MWPPLVNHMGLPLYALPVPGRSNLPPNEKQFVTSFEATLHFTDSMILIRRMGNWFAHAVNADPAIYRETTTRQNHFQEESELK
ncbi:MAG: hypothetical protein ISS70_04860 [Phycisphaerae bacterium]|nr:hypothetical protein [Phycisphaerae bacterium]